MRLILLAVLLSISAHAQVILPVQWSTYLGGSVDDQIRDLCVDKDDNVYVCGVFTSPDFPAARGVPSSFDTSRANGGGYLASFSPTGELRWMQYFGCVRPYEIAISDEGVLVMVGALASECGGNVDATVSTFRTDGERFSRDQFLGGALEDIATTVDIVGNTIYVGGITQSPDLQTTANAFQAGPQGGVDGFVAKLDLFQTPAGWEIKPDVVSYFGGRFLDEVLVVRARNTLGHVYVGGRTRSDKLPGNGVLQPTRIGTPQDDDGFVARLDTVSLQSQWHTYCGGEGNEVVYGLQPDRSNQPGPGGEPFTLRVCGNYYGADFPLLGDPTSRTPFVGGTARGGDAFLLQIRDGAMMQATTWSVTTTADDVLYSFTRGNTNTGPLMFSNGFFTCQNSTFNAYRLNPYPGSNPTGLSAFCGNKDELTLDVEQFRFGFGGIDEGPNSSYICGSTTSTVIPGTDAAGPVLQRAKVGSGRNGFLVKIGCGSRATKLLASDSVLCANNEDSTTLSLQHAPSDVVWGDGATDPTRVVKAAGTYKVKYIQGGCEFTDSVVIKSGSLPSVQITPKDTVSICDTSGVLLTLSGQNIERVFWSTGELGADTILEVRSIRVRTPGRYFAVVFSSDGCSATTDTVTVITSSSGGSTPLLLSYAGADSAKVNSTVRVIIRIAAPNGTALESLPTEWSAVVRFNKTMLFPVRPLGRGTTDDSLRSIKITGRRKPSSDTRGFFDLRVALGARDSTSIIVDSLDFDPCASGAAPSQLPFRTVGICRIDSVGRFVTFRRARLAVAVASNPVGPEGAIGSAVGEDLSQASARIVSIIGEEINLGIGNTQGDVAEWTIPSWLPVGRYVFVVTSAKASASIVFEVVR
ncbi:MAG: SBBP repeat-containing protein [Bacteroidota bacterium]